MKTKPVVSLSLLVLVAVIMLSIHLTAQTANRRASPEPSPAMAEMKVQLNAQLKSNTAATNMADRQVADLMNDASRTNFSAQLWARMVTLGTMGTKGWDIAVTVRVLECLRAGRTNDAISELEAKLDEDLLIFGDQMLIGKQEYKLQAIPQQMTPLRRAKGYRMKFPRKTGDATTDGRVERALSQVEEK